MVGDSNGLRDLPLGKIPNNDDDDDKHKLDKLNQI